MYRINSHGQATRGRSAAWGWGEVLTTPHHKKLNILRNIPRSIGKVAGFCECGDEPSGL